MSNHRCPVHRLSVAGMPLPARVQTPVPSERQDQSRGHPEVVARRPDHSMPAGKLPIVDAAPVADAIAMTLMEVR